ncbi:MAG: Cna B-type domain-containing protein, partial [Clostridia bacterium]|nr:Cna B-type domain-containing protein [Clostridia bacterium]
ELTDTSVEGKITTLTNTHETEETEATVIKVWDDEEDQDGIRPEKLTVELLVNGESFGLEVELNEENGWTAKIDQLDKYMGGEEIEYKWTELDLPEGYELTDTSVEGKITTLTNTHVPGKVSVSVEKQWRDDDNRDGLRPQSITVQLTANGVNYGAPVVLNESNNWKHTWVDLDEKAEGKTILYEVEELDVPFGYGIIINGNPTDGYLIINPHDSEKIELEGVKIWVGETDEEHQRPASVTIRLYADGVEIDHAVCTAAGGWTFKFTDLYKYNNGKEIKYTITEDPVVGYSTSIEGMTVTNTWIPSPPTGDKGIVSYIAILFASLAVFVSAVVRRRKRRTV